MHIPKGPNRWQKNFMPGTAQKIEEKRAEALELLQNEKENAVTTAYEQARKMLIEKSNEFNPQRDIGYIQQMQEEYDAVIQGEEQFKQKQWSLIEKILTILVVLGLLKKTDTYDQNSSTLIDDLHGFLQDAEVAKKIMTLGLPELPKTSGQYIAEGVASFQEHINTIQIALQQMKTMKTPEDLEKELLDVFFAKDREQGSLSSEKVLSKAGIDMVHEYRNLYTTKQQAIEQRWDAIEQERKQLVNLLIKEAKYTGVVTGIQSTDQWDAMQTHDLSDNELDEYGEKIQKQIEEHQSYQGQVTTQYTKLESIMNQLLFPEGDIGNTVTGWKVKNESTMTERTMIRDERKKIDQQNQKIIVQLQEYVKTIEKEQTIRAFEKIKQKYEMIITQLKKQWTTLEGTLLKAEKDAIDQKRKVLGEKLVQGAEINMQEAINEIAVLEQQYREGKNHPDFKKRVEIALQTQWNIGSIEHRLIEQGLFSLSDDDLTKLPEELAKQEQEGKKTETLELKKERSPELQQSQTEKRAWAEQQSEKQKYLEVATILDEYFNTRKIKEGVHNGRGEVQISGVNLKNKTNYALRKKAVEVPKDGSRGRADETTYVKGSKHYHPQSEWSKYAFGEPAKEADLIFQGTINNESEKLSKVFKENVYDQGYELPEGDVKTNENEHMILMKQLLPKHLHDEKRLVRGFTYMCDAPLRQWYLHPGEVQRNDDGTYKGLHVKSGSRLCMKANANNHWRYSGVNDNVSMAFHPSRSR